MLSTNKVEESSRDLSHPENIKSYVYAKEFPTLFRIMNIVLHMLQHKEKFNLSVTDFNAQKDNFLKGE